MKIGILSSCADCTALLRQLLAGRDCASYGGADGLAAAREDGVDALVIDLDALQTTPALAVAGLRALRETPRADGRPPAVLLLAGPRQKALLQALRAAGADDYLLKPMRRNELALRLELLLHGVDPQATQPVVQAGDFVFDLGRLRVSSPMRPALDAALTQKEAELALLLLHNLGRPLSRAFLQERIWGAEPELPTRTIDTHVSRVRTKLGLKPEHGYRLATVYGYGYQLERLGQDGAAAPH